MTDEATDLRNETLSDAHGQGNEISPTLYPSEWPREAAGGSRAANVPAPPRRLPSWSVSMDERGTVQELAMVSEPSPEVQRVLEKALGLAGRLKEDRQSEEREAAQGSATSRGLLHCNPLGHKDLQLLLSSRGADFDAIVSAADAVRRLLVGDEVTYVVNRNINYTNVCTFK